MRIALPLAAALAVLPMLGEDAGKAKIDPKILEHAIQTYAPVLHLHQKEKYKPTCWESFQAAYQPYSYTDREDGKTYVGLMLRNPGDPAATAGDPARAKAYVNVKVSDQTTSIQYWFLYAYNGPGTAYLKRLQWARYVAIGDYELGEMGVHEGDWEHIAVSIDNATGKALQEDWLYMAAHDSGGWSSGDKAWRDFKNAKGVTEKRVQVYASLNGHATYSTPERHYNSTVKAGFLEFRLLNDTATPGDAIDYRNRCEVIGIQGDPALKKAMAFQEPPWISSFPGRWGRINIKPHPYADVPVFGKVTESILKAAGALDEMTFEAGPMPPWRKGNWTGPE